MIESWVKITALVLCYLIINIAAIITIPLWFIPYGIWFNFDEIKQLCRNKNKKQGK